MILSSLIQKVPAFQPQPQPADETDHNGNAERLFLAVANYFQANYNKRFDVDNENEKQIEMLLNYFTSNPAFENSDYKLNKGLLILGDIGCGKSSLIHCFCEVLKTARRGFKRFNCPDIDDDFAKNGYNAFDKYKAQYVQYYDDVGRENIMIGSYANKESTMIKIMEFRYRLWVESHIPTYYSTNMNGDSFKARYDDYVYSRIKESCNVISFKEKGKNRRLK